MMNSGPQHGSGYGWLKNVALEIYDSDSCQGRWSEMVFGVDNGSGGEEAGGWLVMVVLVGVNLISFKHVIRDKNHKPK